DCSGLVYRGYSAGGIQIPRDADDQHRRALRIGRASIKPGDPVFLSKPTGEIFHVMLHAGGDSLVESRQRAGVLKTTYEKRFGKRHSAIESGDLLDNLPGHKPSKVRVSFG